MNVPSQVYVILQYKIESYIDIEPKTKIKQLKFSTSCWRASAENTRLYFNVNLLFNGMLKFCISKSLLVVNLRIGDRFEAIQSSDQCCFYGGLQATERTYF